MTAMMIICGIALFSSLWVVVEDLSPLTTVQFFSVVLIVAMHYFPGAFA